jgi:hypothetical protein
MLTFLLNICPTGLLCCPVYTRTGPVTRSKSPAIESYLKRLFQNSESEEVKSQNQWNVTRRMIYIKWHSLQASLLCFDRHIIGEVGKISILRKVLCNTSKRNRRISFLSDILSVLFRPYYPVRCGTSFTEEVLMSVVLLLVGWASLRGSSLVSWLKSLSSSSKLLLLLFLNYFCFFLFRQLPK